MTRWLAVLLVVTSCQTARDPAEPPAAGRGSASSAPPRPEPADAAPPDSADPGDDTSASATDMAAETPPGFDFDKLDHDAKVRFMRAKVLPAMRDAFQKFDPEKYATFTCKTCHGKNAFARKYKMPSPELPQLDFAAIERGKQKPQVVNFMSRVVKPQIAKIFDRPQGWAFQPGHGCLECHTEKK